jgi:UDP-N-acetylmuramate dehydrogenase
MILNNNYPLKQLNSFGINVTARQFASFTSADDLRELISHSRLTPDVSRLSAANCRLPTVILGGGSNLLFTKNVDALVLKNEVTGMEKVKEDDAFVYIKVGAGENWHRFVMYCIENNLAGVENLSLIPGNVGASPMQNIGAYGVELKDVFYELEAFHLQDAAVVKFGLNDCAFGYRESVFKQQYKGQFAILNVTYKLRKQPQFNTSYGAIEQELEKMGVTQLSIRAISQAVINIRSSKLPDPAVIGNAGSFFKNPTIAASQFESLKSNYPNIVGYANADGSVKLAAGWLIEQCGPADGTSWKGYRKGDAGCHAKQALVLVNYGNASGREIYDLSEAILQSVQIKFGVVLEREVNIF